MNDEQEADETRAAPSELVHLDIEHVEPDQFVDDDDVEIAAPASPLVRDLEAPEADALDQHREVPLDDER